MDNKSYLEAMKRCFNAAFTGCEHPEKRKECYQTLLREYDVVGGMCIAHFVYTMEMYSPENAHCASPKEYLLELFAWIKAVCEKTPEQMTENWYQSWGSKGVKLYKHEGDFLNVTRCIVVDVLQHFGMNYKEYCAKFVNSTAA